MMSSVCSRLAPEDRPPPRLQRGHEPLIALESCVIRHSRIAYGVLKPQDIVVCVALATPDAPAISYQDLARLVGLSASEAHASVARAVDAGLLDRDGRTVRRGALLEFLVHGVRYAFAPHWRGVTRGIPTAHAGPPLNAAFAEDDLPPVWPDQNGKRRGQGLDPLYRSVPRVAMADANMYEWLSLIDALRAGRARERSLAQKEITRRLSA